MKSKNLLVGIVLSSALFSSTAAWADAYLDQAKLAVEKATAPVTQWDGPTTGPQLVAGKRIIFIASDMKNGGVQGGSFQFLHK